jgi:perosamine synthetase
MIFIPVNEPLLDGNEKKYLCECIDSGWISSEGPFVEKFENNFASFTGVRHGTAVCNGTAALETALYAIGIGHGDEVIMPSFTIISCAIACIRLGATPVLVDIDPETWTMDTAQVETIITERTKAIMPVHIYGHPVFMDDLFRIKNKYKIRIVEDAAEAHGAEYFSRLNGGKWLKCGAMGDIAATSFYANKIVTTGEGGMVLTDNAEYHERAKSYRNLFFIPEKRFFHEELGYNFRMTNMQAAVGLAQIERIDRFIKIKKRLGMLYGNRIARMDGIRFMKTHEWADPVYWMYSVELDPERGISAEQMMIRLKKRGIGTRPFFRGLHDQPALKKLGLFKNQNYPATDKACHYGFYLPSGLNLTENDVDFVVNAIERELK